MQSEVAQLKNELLDVQARGTAREQEQQKTIDLLMSLRQSELEFEAVQNQVVDSQEEIRVAEREVKQN